MDMSQSNFGAKKSTQSQFLNDHPWGCPTYVLDPRLQDGFKILKWDPRARQGIYLGPSPLHAESVELILNPKNNRISPQYHCIYDDYFETVTYDENTKPPNWDELIVNSTSKVDLEYDETNEDRFVDTWNETPQVNDTEGEDSRDSAQAPESFSQDAI